jgi:uncharacterized protein YdeI (YjbR/CyaY-like superfamily)
MKIYVIERICVNLRFRQPPMPELDFLTVPTRAAWRDWLAENHGTSPGVWFVFFKKKSGQPTLTYDEAVEEALCFGWIDSLPKKMDDERHALKFSPRKPKSVWSKLNKTRIEKLLADGLMTPAGQAKIDAAKRDGSWTELDEVEDLRVPDDLTAALAANAAARQNFEAYAPSVKKPILYWIQSAKRPETRQARIEKTVAAAAAKKNPLIKS